MFITSEKFRGRKATAMEEALTSSLFEEESEQSVGLVRDLCDDDVTASSIHVGC